MVDDRLGRPGGRRDDAEHGDAEADMGKRRAEGRARQADEARAQRDAGATLPRPAREARSDERAEHQPDAEADAERGEDRRAGRHEDARRRCRRGAPRRRRTYSRSAAAQQVAALPGEQRPERHGDSSSGTISGTKVRLKNGAPTEIFVAGQRLQRQRIERADEHRRRRRRQEQVVEDERALAADRREQAALLQRPARARRTAPARRR